MPYEATVYKVLIASPSDVREDRDVIERVVNVWNAIHSEINNVVLLPVRWETHSVPEINADEEDAQTILTRQIVKTSDLLIGTFWTRIGTQTDNGATGTVSEIREFIGSNKPVMLYFSRRVIADPLSMDLDQLAQLKKFKDSLSGLYGEYDTLEDLRSDLTAHLTLKINEIHAVPIREDPSKQRLQELEEAIVHLDDKLNPDRKPPPTLDDEKYETWIDPEKGGLQVLLNAAKQHGFDPTSDEGIQGFLLHMADNLPPGPERNILKMRIRAIMDGRDGL